MNFLSLVAVYAQKEYAPYRRESDNTVGLNVSIMTYAWCMALLYTIEWEPSEYLSAGVVDAMKRAFGTILLIWTVAVSCQSLRLVFLDVRNDMMTYNVNEISDTERRTYKKGDFIILQSSRGHSVMDPTQFLSCFSALAEPPSDPADARRGYLQYRSSGSVWARKLSASDIRSHFPAGQLVASHGGNVRVAAGDIIAMPFPFGGELFRMAAREFEDAFKSAATDRMFGSRSAGRVLTQAEVLAQWDSVLRLEGCVYRKHLCVHAKIAHEDGSIDTIVDGILEGRQKYKIGDYIMRGARGGLFRMKEIDFAARYSRVSEAAESPSLAKAGFSRFKPIGKIWARAISAAEIARNFPAGKFFGKWGGIVTLAPSDMLALPWPAGGEIYAIKNSAFKKTYHEHTAEKYVPSQAEALMHWAGVLQKDGIVFRRAETVLAKIADEDGTLTPEESMRSGGDDDVGDDDATDEDNNHDDGGSRDDCNDRMDPWESQGDAEETHLRVTLPIKIDASEEDWAGSCDFNCSAIGI